MASILRNVKDIPGDDRRSLEHVVGAQLEDNQQVLIHVLDVGVEPSVEVRRAAIQQAATLAEQGRAHAEAQGVTPDQADEVISEAIRHARQRPRG